MLNFHIVWTLSMLIIFIAIFVWAFSRRRQADFDEASRLPLEADESDRIPAPADGVERP